jgi:hypothetical protein
MELLMMNAALECTSHGWAMIAAGILTIGVVALSGAALVKYLFFRDRPAAAA